MFRFVSSSLSYVCRRGSSSCLSVGRKLCDKAIILGIETSCDDTGAAIVDNKGQIVGEALNSQQLIHLEHGGILPPVARDLHVENIEQVVNNALANAKLSLCDVNAIATTVKPGLPLSLVVGMEYGKKLSRISKKPFIPIHHMEAHALTIRMVEEVGFPFLVLLISGGHCLLSVVQSPNDFLLLGSTLDNAPGDVLDKAARRLKLRNIPEFSKMCGGAALEKAAEKGDPLAFTFPLTLLQYRDCNFSFGGLTNRLHKIVISDEKKFGVIGAQVLPSVFDVCASYQYTMTRHICQRVQRAMTFVAEKRLIPLDSQTLVVSGGVACNRYIARGLGILCRELGYTLKIPPPYLCTDNGVMIAWNGVEKWRTQHDIYQHTELDKIDIQAKCPLGTDMRQHVVDANIKCKWIKLKGLCEHKEVARHCESNT